MATKSNLKTRQIGGNFVRFFACCCSVSFTYCTARVIANLNFVRVSLLVVISVVYELFFYLAVGFGLFFRNWWSLCESGFGFSISNDGLMKYTTMLQATLTLLVFYMFSAFPKTHGCQRTLLRANGVTEQEKQTILDVHNRMRQSVALGQVGSQPPAANMMEMKWDDELARRAQTWASSCYSEGHDAKRHISRFSVGQNIATTWTTKSPTSYSDIDSDFPDAIRKWFNEYKYFNFGRVRPGSTGHYTQMLWADTNLIGCGFAFYYDPSKGYTKNYICNYGPGGNVLGQTPYQSGQPNCESHGMVESSTFSGLCDKASNYVYGISNFILDRYSH